MSCKKKRDIVGGITSVTVIPMDSKVDLTNITDGDIERLGGIKMDNSYPLPEAEEIDGKKYYPQTFTWKF